MVFMLGRAEQTVEETLSSFIKKELFLLSKGRQVNYFTIDIHFLK